MAEPVTCAEDLFQACLRRMLYVELKRADEVCCRGFSRRGWRASGDSRVGIRWFPLRDPADSGRITSMRSFLAGIVLVVVLVAAGCGGSSSSKTTPANSSGNGEASKPAQQVLTDAVKAAESASSLHMGGNVSSGGQQIGLDLQIAKDKGATGTMTLNGQKVDLVVVGKDGYLKAGPAFFKLFAGANGATIAQLLAGRWLKFPVDNAQFGPLVGISSANSLFEQLKSGSDPHLKNNGATTYQGQSVVALEGKNGTLYVSATGQPYPVALAKTGSGGGAITFGDWNQPVSLTAPTNVLDFSKLGG
jgi:hypothetical protein